MASLTSYDELIKQVESLKAENSQLQRELQGNSSQLAKLENEATNMTDVLSQLSLSVADEGEYGYEKETSFTADELNQTLQNESVSEEIPSRIDGSITDMKDGDPSQYNSTSSGNLPTQHVANQHAASQNIFSLLKQLDHERNIIVHEIQTENQHRKWYQERIEMLSSKMENMPMTNEYNLQLDMNRRQLQYEVKKLQDSFKDNYGTTEQIAQRHEERLQKIRNIEADIAELQHRHQQMELVYSQRESETSGLKVSVSTQGAQANVTNTASDSNTIPNQNLSSIYHGDWPIQKEMESNPTEPAVVNLPPQDVASVMSFNSTNTSSTTSSMSENNQQSNQNAQAQPQQLGSKVEMVYSLLSMLGTHDKDDMSRTLLAMSSSPDSCIAMRQSGCLPLLIQLLHGSDKDSGLLGNTRGSKAARARAAAALHNIVHSHPDDKRGRREARVLRLLEQIRAHCDQLKDSSSDEEDDGKSGPKPSDIDHHPGPAIAALMKLSFDEEYRHAICTLGGLQAIAELLQVDQDTHGNTSEQYNVTMRRYACMSLTNLTFGDGTNKALLCSIKSAMYSLVVQLISSNEDLVQVAASVLRNLSWRADLASKKTLREVNAVKTLMIAGMNVKKESTLKSILSAVWNLSAHCSENKADICAVLGALAFLVRMLTYKSQTKTLAIVENGGGILRNVSSHIAVHEEYRQVLRQHGCLQILLKQLRSSSLTIVSNACGTLWNLSARCAEDQQTLWDMGAVSMLRNLVHSKHKMIAMGSAAALKNLLAARPHLKNVEIDKQSSSNRPSLQARKQRALEAEIDQNLSETCDNMESPRNSPTENNRKQENDNNAFVFPSGLYNVTDPDQRRALIQRHIQMRTNNSDNCQMIDNNFRPPRVPRSGSQDSVGSTHSDISHDRSRVQHMLVKSSKLLHERKSSSLDRQSDMHLQRQQLQSERGPMERGRSDLPNGRILQVMQEVAMHAGISASFPGNSDSNHSANNNVFPHQTVPQFRNHTPQHDPIRGLEQLSLVYGCSMQNTNEVYPPTTNAIEMEESDDQPVDYSRKYCDTMTTSLPSQPPQQKRPLVQMNNYIRPNVVPNNINMPNRFGYSNQNFHPPQPAVPRLPVRQFSTYAETDLDSDDQPTDFSQRYSENTDDHFTEQPINYGNRYQESDPNCADCKLEEARWTNDRIDQFMPGFNDDQVKTYYTEGTPMNYLSTATSMTDLSKGVEHDHLEVNDKENLKGDESPVDETQNFGTKYGESGKIPEKLTVQQNCGKFVKQSPDLPVISSNDEDSPNHTFHAEDEDIIPPDQTKTYCEEGTPTCFSRVSSLSSLHSSEAQDRQENRPRVNLQLHSIEELDANNDTTFDAGNRTLVPDMDESQTNIKDCDSSMDIQQNESTEKEHKTVTFDDNFQVEETPLMFSRCSSLGSLSSCDGESVHSSVVSDYSRRASEVVSPSELPDSPSETMPPSPKRSKSPSTQDEDEIDEGDTDQNTAETELKRETIKFTDKPEESIGSVPVEKPLLSILKNAQANQFEIESNYSKFETPVVYALEGTPPNFSETSSLSGISIDHEDFVKIDKSPGLKNQKALQDIGQTKLDDRVNINPEELKPDVLDDGSSDSSEGEEDILAQCISSAMPVSKKVKKSSSENSPKKPGILKSTVQQNKSPTKANIPNVKKEPEYPVLMPTSLNKSQSKTFTDRKNIASTNLHALENKDIGDLNDDCVKTYAEEGTPLNFSRTTSLSDLSDRFSDSKNNTVVKVAQNVLLDDSKSDGSSLYDDSDDFLSAVIQSAMPKSKSAQKPHSSSKERKHIERKTSKAKKQLPFQPQRTSSYLPKPTAAADGVKTYAVEDTPVNFSTATSLSDLTIDSIDDTCPHDDINDHCFNQTYSTDHSSTSHMATFGTSGDDSVFLQSESCDSTHVYQVEGTPTTFSRTESLSSLSIVDEDNHEFNEKEKLERFPSKIPSVNEGPVFKVPELPKGKKFVPTNRQPTKQNETVGKYKTPVNQSPVAPAKGHYHLSEQKSSFKVEGTPICFSRNSSLSSLSVNSNQDDLDDDDDDDDEHILDDIIKSAMPKKSKPDKSKSKRSVSLSNSLDRTGKTDKGVIMSGNKLSKSFSAADTVNLMDGTTDWKIKEQNICHSHEDILIATCRDIAGLNLDMDLKTSKYLKDQSNHEIALSKVGTELKNETFSPNDSDLENTTLCSDNKLLNEVETITRNNIRDSVSSAEKVDSEKSYRSSEERISDGLITDEKAEDEICKEAQMLARLSASKTSLRGSMFESMTASRNSMKSSVMSVENISQISFPKDMALDIDDDLLEPVEDLEEDPASNEEQQINETFIADDIDEADESLEHLQKAVFELERRQKHESTFMADMSAEDVMMLEQNASLVVNEIGIGRAMANSNVEDDMFLENETLSLVSNDNTSDTASEISWSHTSDKLSDNSGSTVSQTDSQGTITTGPSGPRILKPSDKTIQNLQGPESPKGVRGRRKPLYSRTSTPSVKTNPSKPELSGVNKGVVKLNYSGQKMKTMFNTPGKKISPKSQNQQTTPNVIKSSPASKNTINTTNKSSTPPKAPPSGKNKTGTTPSRIPCISNSYNKAKGTPDKPKPPVKQRTFTKESTILTAPIIKSSENEIEDGSSNIISNHVPPKSTCDVQLREKRPSGDSLPPSNRNSGESFNGSAGDSKDSSADDSGQEHNKSLPDESTIFKKPFSAASSKSSLSSSPRSSTGNLKMNSSSKSNLTKTLSGSNLKKTASGSSLAKSGSGNVLNSGNSNGNLRKLGNKELKKSESSASLKKTNDMARPTTPVGRKLSPAITPNKKTDVSPPSKNGNGDPKRKKQVESKIAGLWKKEDAANNTSTTDSPVRTSKLCQGKSPNRPCALPTQINRRRTASTSPVRTSRKPYTPSTMTDTSKETIPRSSTYEKLDTTTDSSHVPSIDGEFKMKSNEENDSATREVIGAEKQELQDVTDRIKDLSTNDDADTAFIEDSVVNDTVNNASVNQTFDTTVDVSLDVTASDISFEPDKTFSRINNGTWKKKKSLNDPNSLPNADETRKVGKESKPKKSKSLWRRSSDSKNKSQKDNEVWVKKDTSINELNESSQKKSKEGSKLKKLGLKIFSRSKSQKSSKHKESPVEELDVSAMVAEGLCPSSANSSEALSATLPLPPKCLTQDSHLQPITASSSFSYPSTQRAQSSDELLDNEEFVDDLPAVLRKTSSLPLPTMHMTKTEMLLARRKQSYLNSSIKSEESVLDENKGCKVTTV